MIIHSLYLSRPFFAIEVFTTQNNMSWHNLNGLLVLDDAHVNSTSLADSSYKNVATHNSKGH